MNQQTTLLLLEVEIYLITLLAPLTALVLRYSVDDDRPLIHAAPYGEYWRKQLEGKPPATYYHPFFGWGALVWGLLFIAWMLDLSWGG